MELTIMYLPLTVCAILGAAAIRGMARAASRWLKVRASMRRLREAM